MEIVIIAVVAIAIALLFIRIGFSAEQKSTFLIDPRDGKLIDPRDGKIYRTVKIGTQIWMAENFNYEAEGKCYDDDPSNGQKYGRLYDWKTAMKVCPAGWHLPSDAEWGVLLKYVNPSYSLAENICANAGTNLKATSGWYYKGSYYNGEDSYGFAALPGGYCGDYNNFRSIGNTGYWWSASETESNSGTAYARLMYYTPVDVDRFTISKDNLCSVRYVQD